MARSNTVSSTTTYPNVSTEVLTHDADSNVTSLKTQCDTILNWYAFGQGSNNVLACVVLLACVNLARSRWP